MFSKVLISKHILYLIHLKNVQCTYSSKHLIDESVCILTSHKLKWNTFTLIVIMLWWVSIFKTLWLINNINSEFIHILKMRYLNSKVQKFKNDRNNCSKFLEKICFIIDSFSETRKMMIFQTVISRLCSYDHIISKSVDFHSIIKITLYSYFWEKFVYLILIASVIIILISNKSVRQF